MRATILAGALAMTFWGVSARAAEDSASTTTQSTRVQTDSSPSTVATPPNGAVNSDNSNANSVNSNTGSANVAGQPNDANSTTTTTQTDTGTAPNPNAAAPSAAPAPDQSAVAPSTTDQNEVTTVTQQTTTKPEHKANMKGLTLMLGGGVEGYTGSLAGPIKPGPTWGVTAILRPTRVLGIELGYSGATNELDRGNGAISSAAEVRGADIIRNGGRALATFGLTASPVQPYVAAGIGYDHYDVRVPNAPFRSDNSGSIPLGVGLRTHVGAFTADARAGYSLLFNTKFSELAQPTSVAGINTINSGRWSGTLSLGSTF